MPTPQQGPSAPAWQPPASDLPKSPFNAADTPADNRPTSSFNTADQPWQPPASDIPTAKPLDFSAQAIPVPLDFSKDAVPWTPPESDRPVSASPLDAARNSAGSIVSGIGKFGGVVDSAIARNAPAFLAKALGATGDIANGTDQAVVDAGNTISGPRQYQPAPVHQLGADLANGRPLAALNDAGGVVAGALPYAATALVPGAGPLLLGASGAGNTAADRMAAKGETSPSLGDALAGAGSGILNAAGGGVAHGLTGGVLSDAARHALGPLADTLAGRIGVSAVAGGGLGAANDVLATAGTGNLTPGGVGSAALEGAGSGLLTGGVVQGTKDAAGALHTFMSEPGAGVLHPDQAGSIIRVGAMAAQRVTAAKAAGQSLTPTDALNTLGSQLDGELTAHVGGLKAAGQISAATQQAVIMPLMKQARAGSLFPSDAAVPSSPLGQFDALGLPPATVAVLRDGLLDLSTINRDGGSGRGLVAPLIDKLANHSTARVLEATLGGVAGYHAGGAEGAALGGVAGVALPALAGAAARGIDGVLGANAPPVLGRQQAMAAAALSRAGLPMPTSSLDALQAARQATASADQGQTPEANGAARAAQNQAGMLARLGPDHPVGAAAMMALSNGNADLAKQALTQFAAMGSVRDAKAAGVAHDAAAGHQLNLDAAAETPAGGSIEAVNAANAQTARSARATMRLAGGAFDIGGGANRAAGGSGGSPSGVPQQAPQNAADGPLVTSRGNGAGGDGTAYSESTAGRPNGLMGLADHLSGQALWSHGTALAPADLKAGLDHAAAAGAIAPAQYGVLQQHLQDNAPLWHTGGAATGALNALVSHALAVKAGGDLAAASPILRGGAASLPNGGARPVQNVHHYQQAAATYQADLQDRINAAETSGDPALVAVLRNIRSVPAVADKQALAAAYLDSLGHDVVARAKAKAAMGGNVLMLGKKN